MKNDVTQKLCKSKDIIKRVRRKTREFKKIFAIHIVHKGYIYSKYKEFLQVKKNNNPMEKWAKDLNRQFIE